MFELPWSHLLLFGLAALVLIPSKDLPKVLRQAGRYWGDAQRMARDFRNQITEALRESELHEIKEGLAKDLRDIERSASMSEEQKAWNSNLSKATATAGTQPETRAADAANGAPTGQIIPPVGTNLPVVETAGAHDAANFGGGATVPMQPLDVAKPAAAMPAGNGLAARAQRTDGIDIVRAGRGSVALRAAAAWKKSAGSEDAAKAESGSESGA
jgi:sec-independent protein translocase protein TatB